MIVRYKYYMKVHNAVDKKSRFICSSPCTQLVLYAPKSLTNVPYIPAEDHFDVSVAHMDTVF